MFLPLWTRSREYSGTRGWSGCPRLLENRVDTRVCPYLTSYAPETAFRNDPCRDNNASQFRRVVQLVAATSPSVDFIGYKQRARAA